MYTFVVSNTGQIEVYKCLGVLILKAGNIKQQCKCKLMAVWEFGRKTRRA